jgi:hypothetical protein
MKRAVHDKIGGLAARFGLGFFDDDDPAERARRAGFEPAVAHDLFIHHFGSRTFVGNDVDAEGLLDENARRFADKWGLAQARGRRVVLRPFDDTQPDRTHPLLVPTLLRGNTAPGRSASLPVDSTPATGETRSVEEDVPTQSVGTRKSPFAPRYDEKINLSRSERRRYPPSIALAPPGRGSG